MKKHLFIGLLVFTGCALTPTPAPVKTATRESVRQSSPAVPLSQIDLSKIGGVTPKGHVQDRDYNNLRISLEI